MKSGGKKSGHTPLDQQVDREHAAEGQVEVPPSTRNQRRVLLRGYGIEDGEFSRGKHQAGSSPRKEALGVEESLPAKDGHTDSSDSEGDKDDQEYDDEGEEDPNSELEEGEEEEEILPPRYSRRDRNQAHRYSPEKPKVSGRRSHHHPRSHAVEDLDDAIEDSTRVNNQPGRLFTQRYSARPRRAVDRFIPGTDDPPGSNGDNHGNTKKGSADRTYRAAKRARHDPYAVPTGEDPPGISVSESEGDDGGMLGDDRGVAGGRKTYSFRDRSIVTIQPAQRAQQNQKIAGSLREKVRDRQHQRRRGGGSSRDRAGGFDELFDLPLFGPGPGLPNGLTGPSQHWNSVVGAAGVGNPKTHQYNGNNKNNNNNAAIAGGAGAGTSAAAANLEITPLEVDPSVSFDQVGGLEHYVRALKEMVFLPLVYPELFERFHVSPPRGVLFYGPPGTGKTLVARALAAHASRAAGGRKVSFFMRKGADVLSKWVGESERHLRLLFEEARRHEPSIIFFDEIDGLAPVRSSRSDQIHNSIVSTLLALMDGLDKRGQVVIIGATNRVDALDGALRRPGRFDRELLFPLPNQAAREEILHIHTCKWEAPPHNQLLGELAATCVGYCGADLKALVTEASLAALRRRYPQIYDSQHKLEVNPKEVCVEAQDFIAALQNITPASHRAAASPARPLPALVAPVLLPHLQAALAQVQRVFPQAAATIRASAKVSPDAASSDAFGWSSAFAVAVQRPRLLVAGPPGSGQAHLGPALLYALEGLPAHAIGLPSLLTDPGARSPEEALVHAVAEARRSTPAILYLPHLDLWWETAPPSLRATLWTLLADLPADLPLLLLATADVAASEMHPEAAALFGRGLGGQSFYALGLPTHTQRLEFFSPAATLLVAPPPSSETSEAGNITSAQETPPALPISAEGLAAEEAARREAERAETRRRYEDDQALLRSLRMSLRSVVFRLLQERKYRDFWEPVSPDDDPLYWQVVSQPMDLTTLLDRIDKKRYTTPAQFLADVSLIPTGERQFLGDKPPTSEDMRHIGRASALEDEARSLVEGAVRPELTSKLEAMLSRGGPTPAPAGLNREMGLNADGTIAQPATKAKGRAAHARSAGAGAGGSLDVLDGGGLVGRRSARHCAGNELDKKIVHGDPEAERRRLRALKKREQEELRCLLVQEKEEEEEEHVGLRGDAGLQSEEGGAQQAQQTVHNSLVGDGGENKSNAEIIIASVSVLAASSRDNLPDGNTAVRKESEPVAVPNGDGGGDVSRETCGDVSIHSSMSRPQLLTDTEKSTIASVQRKLTDRTAGLCLESLEEVHACVVRLAWSRRHEGDKHAVIERVMREVDEHLRRVNGA